MKADPQAQCEEWKMYILLTVRTGRGPARGREKELMSESQGVRYVMLKVNGDRDKDQEDEN